MENHIITDIVVANIKPIKSTVKNQFISKFDKDGTFINCYISVTALALELQKKYPNVKLISIKIGIRSSANPKCLIKSYKGFQYRYTNPDGTIIEK